MYMQNNKVMHIVTSIQSYEYC